MLWLRSPVTWFINDVIVLALWVTCLVHALRQDDSRQRVIFLVAFTIWAAIFENFGVWTGSYDYDTHRLLGMIGTVPLGVLLLEGVIVYSAYTLLKLLKVPPVARAFAAGLLASFQDLSTDPSAVHDRYDFGAGLTGQWNWPEQYPGDYFGIPYFNFSGWFYFTVSFVLAFELVMFLLRRKGRENTDRGLIASPFMTSVVAFVILVPFGFILVTPFTLQGFWPELIALVINYAVGLFCLLRWGTLGTIHLRKNWTVLVLILAVLHGYDIVVGLATGDWQAYVPALMVTLIHAAVAVWFLRALRRRGLLGWHEARAGMATPG